MAEFKHLITFNNRYPHCNVFMVHVDNGLYKLYMEGCYYHTPHSENGKLVAIDPDGGPWIYIGMEIDQYVIDNMFWDEVCNCYLIELKHKN